ncbi:hypothetical protein C2I36_08000 [Rhodobacteraceae bacterium WD3A24]|nr:hypothetical protein C2I36_08000 [Rhodobacteraceae bacterium WD3A24]
METIDTNELEIETLAGDVRDAVLTRVRDLKRPWSMLTEEEQRDLANGFELMANDLVRNAVRMLNDHEWPFTVVKLGDVKIAGGDKGIEAKITASNIEHNRTVLGDHVGDYCTIMMVDSEAFMGEREAPPIDPDQPDLPGADGEADE